jgi:phosphoribosylglycinamide formyltransferase 1
MAATKLNLAILISGRGSNMQALIEACRNPDFPAVISIVISSRADAAGLKKAAEAGIPVSVVERTSFNSKAAFESVLQKTLSDHPIDLICLAGFMHLLSSDFIASWQNRIINIHPSLLPAYKGLDTHTRVLGAGDRETGCSVHFVTPDMDDGPLILQKKVSVRPGDTPDILAERVLEQEHIAYPEAIRQVAMSWPECHIMDHTKRLKRS